MHRPRLSRFATLHKGSGPLFYEYRTRPLARGLRPLSRPLYPFACRYSTLVSALSHIARSEMTRLPGHAPPYRSLVTRRAVVSMGWEFFTFWSFGSRVGSSSGSRSMCVEASRISYSAEGKIGEALGFWRFEKVGETLSRSTWCGDVRVLRLRIQVDTLQLSVSSSWIIW